MQTIANLAWCNWFEFHKQILQHPIQRMVPLENPKLFGMFNLYIELVVWTSA